MFAGASIAALSRFALRRPGRSIPLICQIHHVSVYTLFRLQLILETATRVIYSLFQNGGTCCISGMTIVFHHAHMTDIEWGVSRWQFQQRRHSAFQYFALVCSLSNSCVECSRHFDPCRCCYGCRDALFPALASSCKGFVLGSCPWGSMESARESPIKG